MVALCTSNVPFEPACLPMIISALDIIFAIVSSASSYLPCICTIPVLASPIVRVLLLALAYVLGVSGVMVSFPALPVSFPSVMLVVEPPSRPLSMDKSPIPDSPMTILSPIMEWVVSDFSVTVPLPSGFLPSIKFLMVGVSILLGAFAMMSVPVPALPTRTVSALSTVLSSSAVP